MRWVNLARYSFHRNEYGTYPTAKAKRKLFEPNRKGRTSVACADHLDQTGITALGKDRAQERADRSGHNETLYGWAELAASSVNRAGLSLIPDTKRHADIMGWPNDKEERRFKQQHLAKASAMVLLDCPHVATPA